MTNICQKGLTRDGGGGGLLLSIKEVGTEGMWEGAFFAFWW